MEGKLHFYVNNSFKIFFLFHQLFASTERFGPPYLKKYFFPNIVIIIIIIVIVMVVIHRITDFPFQNLIQCCPFKTEISVLLYTKKVIFLNSSI